MPFGQQSTPPSTRSSLPWWRQSLGEHGGSEFLKLTNHRLAPVAMSGEEGGVETIITETRGACFRSGAPIYPCHDVSTFPLRVARCDVQDGQKVGSSQLIAACDVSSLPKNVCRNFLIYHGTCSISFNVSKKKFFLFFEKIYATLKMEWKILTFCERGTWSIGVLWTEAFVSKDFFTRFAFQVPKQTQPHFIRPA